MTINFGQKFRSPWAPAVLIRSVVMCTFAGCCLVVGISAAQLPNEQVNSVSGADIQSLIVQLGSDDYQTREQAEAEILKIGSQSIEPIRRARSAADSEIRFRARRLLPLLMRADFETRIQEFVNSGTNEASSITLNGWNEFAQIVGSEKPARELYVAIYMNSPGLFDALESEPDLARVQYERIFKSRRRPAFRSGLEMASFVFVDIIQLTDDVTGNRVFNVSNRLWVDPESLITTANLLSNQSSISFVQSSGFKNELRLLIKNWIQLLPANDQWSVESRMKVIEAHKLREWLPFVIDTANNSNESVQRRARAISVIAKLGGPSEIKPLQSLLEQKSTVGHFAEKLGAKKRREVQLRDVALAACVFLSGQDFESYGFAQEPPRKETVILISQSGFISDVEREQALKKWNQFYRDNLKTDE